MSPAVEALQISVHAGPKALLDGVTLSIGPGETLALVGPNGAGKSTLLRTVAGELACGSGTVRLKGREPRSYGARTLALHRAVLSQSVHVAFPFSVTEVVRMGAGERRGRAVDAMVESALERVDLGDFRDRIIGTLSGGEQQRAHFARIMVQLACGEAEHGPGVLLLDEPTASLDLRHQIDIVDAARACAGRGTAVVAVVHDLNLATLFAGRIAVLDRGRLACDGAPGDVVTEDVVRRIFGVTGAAGQIPPDGAPFVLPHRARKAS